MLNDHNDHNEKFVLITTANTPYFNTEEFNALVIMIKNSVSICEELGLKVIFRIFDKDLLSHLERDIDNYIECPLSNVLEISSIVLSTPSTLNVDIASYNLPLASFIYRNAPVFNSGGWIIYDEISAMNSIKQMIYGESEMDFIERMNFQKSQYFNDSTTLDEILMKDSDNVRFVNDINKLSNDIRSFSTYSYFKFFISLLISYLKKISK